MKRKLQVRISSAVMVLGILANGCNVNSSYIRSYAMEEASENLEDNSLDTETIEDVYITDEVDSIDIEKTEAENDHQSDDATGLIEENESTSESNEAISTDGNTGNAKDVNTESENYSSSDASSTLDINIINDIESDDSSADSSSGSSLVNSADLPMDSSSELSSESNTDEAEIIFIDEDSALNSDISGDFKPEIVEYTNEESGFSHPGVGLTKDMLDTVQTMVNSGEDPWITYYNDMLESSYASKSITINLSDPVNTSYNSQGTNSKFIKDALAAYTQAILYYVTGDNVYRKNCMDIIRSYEQLSPDKYAYFTDACIHTGIPMNRFCMALEIMRYSTYQVTDGYTEEELKWTDEDTDSIINNLLQPSVDTFMSSNDEFMNQHLYTTIGAMSAYLFMDDVEGYEKTVEWFTVNADGANPGFNGSIKRLFREITTIDEIGMKEGTGTPLETPVIQHVEMGRDQAHGCGDLTNAAILARLTNGQSTTVDPVEGTVSDAGDAVGCYEFLDNRIINTADFFFQYMLGYDAEWVQVPFSETADGTVIDNYTEFATGYRGRYSTINFWDLYTYYKYNKDMTDEEIQAEYPYFWEGFMKKVPSNFMWNGNKNINWENVDGGGDFWLFLPESAKGDDNYIAEEQVDYIVEAEDRGTLVNGDGTIEISSDSECEYVHVEDNNGTGKIAITSGGSSYKTFAFRVRTDGVSVMKLTNGLKGTVIIPDTNGEWKYVTYTASDTESFGDLYYISFDNVTGTYTDIDYIDIKASDSNEYRTINEVSFAAGRDDYSTVMVAGTTLTADCNASANTGVNYELYDAPEGVAINADGMLTVNNISAGTYSFYVGAYSDNTCCAKKVIIKVAATRQEALDIACTNYSDGETYIVSSLQEYNVAKEEANNSLNLDDDIFAEKLNSLCIAADNLKLVSPLLQDDLYTDGDSLDLNEIVASSTFGNIGNMVDSDPTFGNRIDGKYNYHIIDFGEDYKVSATKFGFKARLGFADRVAGVQVFGSNDMTNWEQLTTNEAAYTMAFQTVDVAENEQDKLYRYLKIQKTTEYPESLRGAYSYMLEFSELRIWGTRVEVGNAIESISLTSDSADNGRIKMNSTVAVTIRTKAPVSYITVNVQGHEISAVQQDDSTWIASTVLASGTTPGDVSVVVNYIKADGTIGDTIYGTTDGSALQLINSDIYIDTLSVAERLVATSISWDKKSTAFECARYLFDGDTSTFGDLANSNGDYYVIDYGEGNAVSVSEVLFMPRSTAANHASRLNGTVLYGTNDELVFEEDGTFSKSANSNVNWVAITPAVSGAVMNTWIEYGSSDILDSTPYRYFKIDGAAQGDVAEVEIYGIFAGNDNDEDPKDDAGADKSEDDNESNSGTDSSNDMTDDAGTSDSATSEASNTESSGNTSSESGSTTEPAADNDVVETPVAVEGIKLNKKSVKVGKKGTYQLIATVMPDNATNKNVVFESSDKKIASVDANGLIKAKKVGSTTVTVTTEDGRYTAKCKVKVTKQIKVTGVKLNKTFKKLKKGKTYQLKAVVKPSNATIKTVTYKSSNKKVATVSSNGLVTAKKKGTATITVKTKDGKYTAKCKITVK